MTMRTVRPRTDAIPTCHCRTARSGTIVARGMSGPPSTGRARTSTTAFAPGTPSTSGITCADMGTATGGERTVVLSAASMRGPLPSTMLRPTAAQPSSPDDRSPFGTAATVTAGPMGGGAGAGCAIAKPAPPSANAMERGMETTSGLVLRRTGLPGRD